MTITKILNNVLPIRVAFAGSSANSLTILQEIADHSDFQVTQVVTPAPQKVGRKQLLTKNPVQLWAENQRIPLLLVEQDLYEPPPQKDPPDYLLVVDFGYWLPHSFLTWPKVAALNLHPAALPAWRGSSPGQMVLLADEDHSAMTLIRLVSKLDSGPIIFQYPFEVDPTWTTQDYYQHSFQMVSAQVPLWIKDHYYQKISEKPQPSQSPTPLARKIAKTDTFIPWSLLKHMIIDEFQSATEEKEGKITEIFASNLRQLSSTSLLASFLKNQPQQVWPQVLERATRAFYPWPILWTIIPTNQGDKRMQILQTHLVPRANISFLFLDQVKIEGQQTRKWSDVKNCLRKEQN